MDRPDFYRVSVLPVCVDFVMELVNLKPFSLDSAAVNTQERKNLLLRQMLMVPCPYLAGSHCPGLCPGVQLQALLSLCLMAFSWQARCAEIILGAAVHQ